ncbi:MAG: hypothetical protein IJM81_10685 [Prevotella sp.]|nr:hypothetical protein [Prevotella sp.]
MNNKKCSLLLLLLLAVALPAAAGPADVAFTNVYARAECYPSGAGQVYMVSDDPEPMLRAEMAQTTEAKFTTGSDGSYKSNTRYWATLQVIPAEGYTCVGVVSKLRADGNYTASDYYVGKPVDDSSPDDSHKNQIVRFDEADNHMMDALCSEEVGGLTINVNTMNTLKEVSNSKNFDDPEKVEKARMAARENLSAWPDEPNVKLIVLFESQRQTTGVQPVPEEPASRQTPTMYNLAGQRVSSSYKGIVIVNGRKYVK